MKRSIISITVLTTMPERQMMKLNSELLVKLIIIGGI